jgi:hypothetical protein
MFDRRGALVFSWLIAFGTAVLWVADAVGKFQTITTMGAWIWSLLNPLTLCAFALVGVAVWVTWPHTVQSLLLSLVDHIGKDNPAPQPQLDLTFDLADQNCKDFQLGHIGYRVRVHNRSKSTSVTNLQVRIVNITYPDGTSAPAYILNEHLDKTLPPQFSAKGTFQLHGESSECVAVAKALAPGGEPTIFLAHTDIESQRGIDAGQYVIVLQAEGHNAVACKKAFQMELTDEGFEFRSHEVTP